MDPNQQPYSPAPQQPVNNGAPQPQAASAEDPGKVLGIIGFIVGFVITPLIGLIMCIIANNQSKKAGAKNTLAIAGIWVHGILTVIGAIAIIGIIILAAAGSNQSMNT